MRRGQFFVRLTLRSVQRRPGQVFLALLAVVIAAVVLTAFLTLSFGIRGSLGRELRSYGANLLLLPRQAGQEVGMGRLSLGIVVGREGISDKVLPYLQEYLPQDLLIGAVPLLYSFAEVNGKKVVLLGIGGETVLQVHPWWKMTEGGLHDNALTVGSRLAKELRIKTGEKATLRMRGQTVSLPIAGVLEAQGDEDGYLLGPLPLVQRLSGRDREIDAIRVSVIEGKRPLEDLKEKLEAALPEVRVKLLHQVSSAEKALLDQVTKMVSLFAGVILCTCLLILFNTEVAAVLERMQEIGLMKALGAEATSIRNLFLAELCLLGIVGSGLGYLVGSFLARLMGKVVFGVALQSSVATSALAVLVALALPLLAGALPVRRGLKVDPAATLRGE